MFYGIYAIFYIIADGCSSVVNIVIFNPWLNRTPVLWCFRHFYGTDIDVFAYAVTIIVNMTIYNLWLNYGYVL